MYIHRYVCTPLYTTIVPRVLVYKILQDFYPQQYGGCSLSALGPLTTPPRMDVNIGVDFEMPSKALAQDTDLVAPYSEYSAIPLATKTITLVGSYCKALYRNSR